MQNELVIARYNENIDWLLKLDKGWNITIYNKGKLLTIPNGHDNIKVINLLNRGREAETIAFHLWNRHGSYADLTVFAQADPFLHAPEFVQSLNVLLNRSLTPDEKYIPLTICYDQVKAKIPPPPVVAKRVNRFYHIEECSVYTLNCIYYNEPTVTGITDPFLKYYRYPINTNIVRRYFQKLGCEKLCLRPNQTTIKFNFSACFAVTSDTLMQYDKAFYQRLHKSSYESPFMPWILERTWLTIFCPDFDYSKVLAEYSLPGPE